MDNQCFGKKNAYMKFNNFIAIRDFLRLTSSETIN